MNFMKSSKTIAANFEQELELNQNSNLSRMSSSVHPLDDNHTSIRTTNRESVMKKSGNKFYSSEMRF